MDKHLYINQDSESTLTIEFADITAKPIIIAAIKEQLAHRVEDIQMGIYGGYTFFTVHMTPDQAFSLLTKLEKTKKSHITFGIDE